MALGRREWSMVLAVMILGCMISVKILVVMISVKIWMIVVKFLFGDPKAPWGQELGLTSSNQLSTPSVVGSLCVATYFLSLSKRSPF
jgi:hypothetical protein